MTEKELQQAVVDLARLCGWLVYHPHDSRKSTPGFPDLVLVRDRVLFRELKTERGRVTPPQVRWISALEAAGVDVCVWRPDDWLNGNIEGELARIPSPGDRHLRAVR